VHRFGLDPCKFAQFVSDLSDRAASFPDPVVTPTCRDPKDDIFIALAVTSRAEYLVTRDDELKRDPVVRDILKDAGTRLVTVREFAAILAGPLAKP
jgi:predicted nucleic acid-binding protein